MKVLTAEAMRAVDRAAIQELGIPSSVLMENAAIGVADAIGESFPEATAVTIVCGPGNNGGDGLALARHLDARGYALDLFLVTAGGEPSGDAGLQLEICRRLGLTVHTTDPDAAIPAIRAAVERADLLVDSLFGTGLSRPLTGGFASLVEMLGRCDIAKLAVDLPSGLSGSRAAASDPHLSVDLTVAFAAPKWPHVLPPACDAVGELVVADLGFSSELVERADGDLYLTTRQEVAALLPRRAADAHKGDVGHVLLVAGSVGKSGAAVLAARAAVLAGAGLVTVAAPQPIVDLVDGGSVESMTLGLQAGVEGQLSADSVAAVLDALAQRDVLAIGPGLGDADATRRAIREIVLSSETPTILDADALNAFAGRLEELSGRPGPRVLTPHPGELARLLRVPVAEILHDRLHAVRQAASVSGAVVVLKGRRTLVASPDGPVHVNPTGNAAMATGGSGDVLTGWIAALAAQGLALPVAATVGVYLHGLAGDLAWARRGGPALPATALLVSVAEAWERTGER